MPLAWVEDMRKLLALAVACSLGGCYFVGKKRGAPADPRAPVTLPDVKPH